MVSFLINSFIQKKVGKILALSILTIMAPMQSYADTEIALSQPYSIPNGVNGNEQTYDNQTFQALSTHGKSKPSSCRFNIRLIIGLMWAR